MTENKNQDFYLELVSNMPHSIFVTNRDGQVIFCNKLVEPTFGETLNKIFKETWLEKFDVYSVDKSIKYGKNDVPISKAILGELLIGEKMYVRNNDNGRDIYLRMCAYPIISDKEQMVVIIFEDITQEQLKYEVVLQRLGEAESYLKNSLKQQLNNKN